MEKTKEQVDKKENPNVSKISKHEDMALKITAMFFRDELMPYLNIEGKVKEIIATESLSVDVVRSFEDFNFLMEDGSIKHFEFQSSNHGKEDLKRFRMYEAILSHQHKKVVTTYVLFSGTIKNPMTEFTEGFNTYRIRPIIMQGKNVNEEFERIQSKIDSGIPLERGDLLPLVLSPLMSGTMPQKERIITAHRMARDSGCKDTEAVRKVEAVLYIMAEKFLEAVELDECMEAIKMTRLGQMLYDNGRQEGEILGRQEGEILGRQEGEASNFLDNIINLQKNMQLSLEAALQALGKTMEDYNKAKSLTK